MSLHLGNHGKSSTGDYAVGREDNNHQSYFIYASGSYVTFLWLVPACYYDLVMVTSNTTLLCHDDRDEVQIQSNLHHESATVSAVDEECSSSTACACHTRDSERTVEEAKWVRCPTLTHCMRLYSQQVGLPRMVVSNSSSNTDAQEMQMQTLMITRVSTAQTSSSYGQLRTLHVTCFVRHHLS